MHQNKITTVFSHHVDHVKISFGLFIADVILSVLFCVAFATARRPEVRGNNAYMANFGWYYIVDGGKVDVTLPCKLPEQAAKNGHVFLFHKVTPDFAGRSLGFYSEEQTVRLSVGDMELYNWQRTGAPKWLKTYGWLFHIIDIPQNTKDMVLCMDLAAEVRVAQGLCSEMYLGTRSEILNKVLALYAPQGIIACLICIIGFFMLFVYIVFRKMFTKDRTIFVLSLLSIAAGLWQLEESKVFYLFCSNPPVPWVLDYMLFLMLPVLLVSFAEEMTGRQNDVVFRILFWCSIIIVVVDSALQFAGIAAFTETVLPIQLLILVTCVYSLISVIRGIGKHGRSTKIYVPAFVILVAGVIGEIVYYNINRSASAFFFALTLLPFFVYLGVNAYIESSNKFHDAEQVAMYHNLAFTDFSSGVMSRTAFYEYIEHCAYGSEYALYMYDLNNLKQINDSYGHFAGDNVIKTFAQCAKEAFAKRGSVYRVGGDEFVVLCREGDAGELEQCELRLQKLTAAKKELPVPLTASYGSVIFTPQCRDDFFAAQKEADARMYEMKREYHCTRGDRRSRRC